MSFPKKQGQGRPEQATPVTAEEIQRTVQAAKALESIPGQELLEDPALNPATRAKYDQLTAERLEAALQADHRRKLAEAAERARVAEEAAQVAEIIDRARRATSPARTILDMSRHQRTFGRVSLAASLLLSVGSAIGLGALVETQGGPVPVGWVAEVGLTGLSTAVIIWRGLLARAGTKIDDRTGRLFLALMVVPLLISIVGSYFGTGPVGVACSVGSALFAGLTYLINTSASAAISQSIAKIDQHQTTDVRPSERPAHTEPARASAPLARPAGDGLEEVGEAIAEGASDWLRSHGNPSERSHGTDRSHGETDLPDVSEEPQVNPSERPRSHEDDEASERLLTAQERRRLEGEKNRMAVARILRERPDALTAEIARETGLGVSTVRRIRREIEEGGTS
ncbi:hypothetical protein [Nocardiopsis ganjiahuensis]|uniref:hypothetical protein n=1 Tax=Nocardiopsis ganjiahuensis TaxID=239984 RepID=UPI000347164A|nr:hypothetical protein [Nocardiopsis ganjiahuensis]